MIQPLWKVVWRFLKKLGIQLLHDPTVPLWGIYPEETIIEMDICSPLFIAALFTVVMTWNRPRYAQTDGRIKKSWCVHTTEYHSATEETHPTQF